MSKLFKTKSTPFQAYNKIGVSVNDMSSINIKSTYLQPTNLSFQYHNELAILNIA